MGKPLGQIKQMLNLYNDIQQVCYYDSINIC